MRFPRILILACLVALIVVPSALALRFTDDSFNMPTGYTGKPYSKQFHGAGGCGPALPYQYSLQNSALPPGLTLSKSGLISGTPTNAGTWSFWVQLSDQNPPSQSWCVPADAQREFTIKVVAGLVIQQTQSTLTPGQLNTAYNVQLTASETTGTTWSVTSGTLPAGIGLNSSTGQLSGTPTAAGSYTFKIQVSDGSQTDAQTYSITVVPQLTLAASSTLAGEVGLPLSLKPTATGGQPSYTWSIDPSTPLPAGLAFDPATGTISGQPAATGTYPLKLTVTDTLGLTKTADLRLAVAAHLAITKKPLKHATVGDKYRATLRATGGVAPRQWRILGGRPGFLPAGLRLNANTGVISGTPRKAGTYRLLFQATDKLGAHSAVSFVLKVSS